MSYAQTIATIINVRPDQVQAVIDLLDSGNTIPFIARYRKEATGTLDEEQIRQVEDLLGKKRALDDRKATILASIAAQDKLTDELRKEIEQADSPTALEDLYQPYKPKRRTRAMIARENGLEGLAELILAQPLSSQTVETIAHAYLSEKAPTIEDALAGARDIVAEMISDHPDVRSQTRQKALLWGSLVCVKREGCAGRKSVFTSFITLLNTVWTGCDHTRSWRSIVGKKKKCSRSRLACLNETGKAPFPRIFARTGARRWRTNSNRPQRMPPSGCSCRR